MFDVIGPFVILKVSEKMFFENPETRVVTEISLSKTPRRLFCYLLEASRLVPREEILVNVLSKPVNHEGNVVQVHVNEIRKELRRVSGNGNWIANKRKQGYEFDPNPPPEV